MNQNLEKKLAAVKKASRLLPLLSEKDVKVVLQKVSKKLLSMCDDVIAENAKDLKKMSPSDPKYDRLLLNRQRVESLAVDILNVANLPSPLNKILDTRIRPNGLVIKKTSVALGVVGVIYEARPNVTMDVFSLCFKAGNACVLKGGSEAAFSNAIMVKIIQSVLLESKLNPDIVFLMPNERELMQDVLSANKYIDVIIPRGSQNLISFVRDNATVPVIETGAGIVHTFFDKSADLRLGKKVICNAKTRRVSVCNALDTLLIHRERIHDLVELVAPLAEFNVEIFADPLSYKILKGKYAFLQKATDEDFGREFLSYKMAIRVVKDLDQALDHIEKHSSKHSEAILSRDKKNIQKFFQLVDAACVYANTSTAFSDGGQFGMGAEIGISTQKLHARGPMALPELTTYKWLVTGDGQIRS